MRKALKIILFTVCGILLLLAGMLLYLNSPWGQSLVRARAEAFLQGKLKTVVHIGHLGWGFPKYIALNDVLFLDQSKDTLLSAGELKIDCALLKLFSKEVDIQQVILKDVHGHVYRNKPDTTFNFSYIIAAFTNGKADTSRKKSDKSAMRIDLDRLKFDNIHFRYDDFTGGVRFATDLDHLDLHMKKLDFDQMLFHVKDLDIAGLQTSFSQDTSYLLHTVKDTAKTKLRLVADNVALKNVGFTFNDVLNKLLFNMQIGGLQMQLNKFGLDDNTIDVKKLALDNTSIALAMGSASTPPGIVDTIIKIDTTSGWHITANDVAMKNVAFKMDNNSEPKQKYGMDYAHMHFKNTDLQATAFHYTSDTISGNINHFSATEQCGLIVQELKTVFNYNSSGATLNDLYLKTPGTTLQDHVEVHYPSLSVLKKSPQSLQLDLDIRNSIVSLPDALLFVPQLKDKEVIQKLKNRSFSLDAVVNGALGNMNITRFSLAGLSNTDILLDGCLSGLPATEDLSYNLHIAHLVSSRKDLELFVPDKLLSSVRIPDKFGIAGLLAGTEKDYNTDMFLMTSDGRANIKGTLSMSPGKNKERYDLLVKTEDLNLGHILKQDSLMGKVSAIVLAKGQSFDPKTMNAIIKAQVDAASIKGYRYHDVSLDGNIAAQKGVVNIKIADPNVRVSANAQADFTGKYTALQADVYMDSIDFRALKLYSSELRTSGVIHIDFPELNPDYPKGKFVWQKPVITANGARYYMDSLYATSSPGNNTQHIQVDLDALQATITGQMPLTKIATVVQKNINSRYPYAATNTTAPIATQRSDTALPGNYSLSLQAHIINKPVLHSLLPGLTSLDSIHVDGIITSKNISANIIAPNIVYGSNSIENGVVHIRSTDSAFTYQVFADKLTAGGFSLWYADAHGNLGQDSVSANISLSDSTHKEEFALAADMRTKGDTQIVHLHKGLKLNYAPWDVAEPNSIVLAKGGFYVQGFRISNGTQYIAANSDVAAVNTPLKIDVGNFLLSDISGIVSKNDSLLVNGVLNGKITVQSMSPSLQMTGDVSIKDLAVLNDTLGDMHAQVNNTAGKGIDTKITLNGHGNDIAINGIYYSQPADNNQFNFDLDVNALALRSMETLAQKQIKNSSGYIRGKLKVKGTVSAPQIDGSLRTDNLTTTVTQLDASFKMPAEKITFSGSKVGLDNFTLTDSSGNKATFNGSVDIADLTNPAMDIVIKATNWRAVHSKPTDNNSFYGDLLLSTNLSVKGTPSAPMVDGSLNIMKGTNFTVVTPESNPQIEATKGVVVFQNMKDTARRNILKPKARDTVKRKLAAGSEINVNVTVSKDATFSLIIDKASGDFLSVKGDASLNAALTRGGVLSLSGNYELYGGQYQMNYNFIKRKFNIQKGSTITFAGDPVKGVQMDITAVYEIMAPAYDLVERQVPDQAQLNYYKQRLPFNVDLHLRGEVMHPAISFDVALPENKVYPLSADQIELIQGKLTQVRNDTSELNKQVFALLILSRFVSDDPFSSGASSGIGFTALQSVSTFIGEQLNQAAGKLVKGIDISADLQTTEDYTTGDMRRRTDFNLSASKTLMNDRLKLTIGNDFELEGPQNNSNSQSDLIPSNLAVDYLLSADGRYSMRAYRKAYDEGVLEGYVTETGINFIVSLDYNHFKNAFRKKKKADTTSGGHNH